MNTDREQELIALAKELHENPGEAIFQKLGLLPDHELKKIRDYRISMKVTDAMKNHARDLPNMGGAA